jgi:isocitrate dehydrogenase
VARRSRAFLGAIGHPDVKPGIFDVGVLLKTRFALDQYINLRPVKLYPNVETPPKDKGPEHIDFVVGTRQDNNHVDACTSSSVGPTPPAAARYRRVGNSDVATQVRMSRATSRSGWCRASL